MKEPEDEAFEDLAYLKREIEKNDREVHGD
jgi:hypothetical protein